MANSREPISRRTRPAKPALTRQSIVNAALAIMRSDGLDSVTMRRLAEKLDTGAASLYVYLRNVTELQAAMLDGLLADIELRPRRTTEWHGQLIAILTAYTTTLFAFPALARSALVLRPSGPNYLALLDRLLTLLRTGGVPVGQAAWGVDLLLQHATAIAAEQSARQENAGADEESAFQEAVQGADADSYPDVKRVADLLFSGSPEQRMKWAFNVLIDGITATALPPECGIPDPTSSIR